MCRLSGVVSATIAAHTHKCREDVLETPAVILLSGGLDSTTVLAIAKSRGFTPYALSFRYGQRHAVELLSAQRVAEAQGVERHVVADIDLRVFGGSALTADIEVPKHDA